MKNLKIRVNSADESKEAQELFFALGYGFEGNTVKEIQEFEYIGVFYLFAYVDDQDLTHSSNLELFNSKPHREITLPEIRAMVNPKMKEYLMPSRDYEYILTDAREALEPHAEDWIELPVGSEFAVLNGDNEINFYAGFGLENSHFIPESIVWQREQDEPFLTPECTLNDQYAEIEEVRKDGIKFDNGKPRHSLLPKGSISSIIAVLEFGAKKYEANNWQKVDNAKERYYDAAMRHIDSWWNGEKFDQETGIHHLAHAATNLFFLKWFDDKENNNG